MSDGSQVEASEESNVKETVLGSKEFSGSLEHKDPMAADTIPAPDGIPEKFWDPIAGKLRTEDLIKSYQSLESKLGGQKVDDKADEEADDKSDDDKADDKKDEVDDEKSDDDKSDDDDDKSDDKKDEKVDPVDFQAAMEAAQKTYAETGDLPEDQRKPFLDMGFTNQQIDLYLNGVKATEAALRQTAHKAAGGEDVYEAAIKWAAENWTEKQILAFNSQTGDVETIGPAVAGLMASFKEANPGEGQLLNTNGDIVRGEVYESMDEFQADLAAADRVRDKVARRKAVDKLARSRAAGTIKHSNRRQPFGG